MNEVEIELTIRQIADEEKHDNLFHSYISGSPLNQQRTRHSRKGRVYATKHRQHSCSPSETWIILCKTTRADDERPRSFDLPDLKPDRL
jgi:hypothetical protein